MVALIPRLAANALVVLLSVAVPGLVYGQSGGGAGDPHLSSALKPLPELPPEEVVRIQLEALRRNDVENRGIDVAFRFASPANRVATGPLSRFAHMIRHGPYALMLNFARAAYGDVEVIGALARIRVTLVGEGGAMAYVFYLSRQSDAPYENCWMTDRVAIEPAVSA